jgi:hypothetical protein
MEQVRNNLSVDYVIIDRDIFKKSDVERTFLKLAKKEWKKQPNHKPQVFISLAALYYLNN